MLSESKRRLCCPMTRRIKEARVEGEDTERGRALLVRMSGSEFERQFRRVLDSEHGADVQVQAGSPVEPVR